MKYLFCFLLALVLHFPAKAQSAWQRESYQTVTVDNFRNYAAFQKAIDSRSIDYALLNACLYYVVSEQRKNGGLAITPYHPALETTAFFHSKAMAEQAFFSHSNPKDPARAESNQRGALAGITNPSVAECIYSQALKPGMTYLALCEGFTKGWMESAGHRNIIMSTNNKAFGAGIYYVANDYFGFKGTLAFQWFRDVSFDQSRVVDHMP